MQFPWTAYLRDRREIREEFERNNDLREFFGPWPPKYIEQWGRSKLIKMIDSGKLSSTERAHAEARLRIVEQEEGPAGRSAQIALWAFWLSLASVIIALGSAGIAAVALWKSYHP